MGNQVIAFGVERDKARYRLRLAKYIAIAERLETLVEEFDRAVGVNANPQYSLLEVGVGKGKNFDYARARGVEHRFNWHGVDLDRFSADQMSGGDQWTLDVADVQQGLPYPDELFDVVIAEQILEHLEDVDASIRELRRITKREGRLIVGVPIYISPVAALRNWYIRTFPGLFARSGSGHVHTFSSSSIVRRLQTVGELEVLDIRGFRILSGGLLRPLENYHWWYRFSLWLGRLLPSLCVEIQMVVRRRG